MDTLLWYWEITLDYVTEMLPCMVIGGAIFLILLPTRRRKLHQNHLSSGKIREVTLFLFVMFCTGLASLTVFPSGFWTLSHWQDAFSGSGTLWPLITLWQSVSNIQWTPTLFRTDITLGEWGLYMMMANALIFLPIGFFPNLLWRRPCWWKGLLVGFCSSFSVEFLQLFAGRSTDIDDLILNSSGAFLGGLLALLLGKMVPNLTRKFQVEVRYGRETGDSKPAPGTGAGQL